MREIGNGVFESTEQMPCQPSDLPIYPYMLPNTFNRAEREEAAARLVSLCQKTDNTWVGVSWQRITEVAIEEHEQRQAAERTQERNRQAEWQYRQEVKIYRLFSVLSLGVYALLGKFFGWSPTQPTPEEVPEIVSIFTVVPMMGFGALGNGFHELQEGGFVRIEKIGEGDQEMHVIFPLPSLAEQILKVRASRRAN